MISALAIATTPRSSHFSLFDSLRDPQVGYAHTTLFECHSPGIADSLRVWAELHRIPLVDVVYVNPDMRCARVVLETGTWLEVVL